MKEFFTYEQQIEKLKEDGLIIDDEILAEEELKLEGYYNIINGYSPIFKDGLHYKSGTRFSDIKALYDFDKSLRSIVYKYTSSIECYIKALIAHEFSRVHGVDEKEYLKKESFSKNAKSVKNVEELISECNKTIKEALNKNSHKYREYIAHNYNTHNHVPMWVLIRAISFGTTSIFYKNMIEDEKEIIAKNYSITAAKLTNMLEVVVSFRNIVAHGERTYCAVLPKTRLTTKLSVIDSMSLPKNDNGDYKVGRKDFLALLICCKYLLPQKEMAGLIMELENILDILKDNLNASMFGKIKIQMGLQTDGWKLLPRLKIRDEY